MTEILSIGTLNPNLTENLAAFIMQKYQRRHQFMNTKLAAHVYQIVQALIILGCDCWRQFANGNCKAREFLNKMSENVRVHSLFPCMS